MKMHKLVPTVVLCFTLYSAAVAQKTYQVALLKYNGGGDWYANPTSLTNLIDFCNKNLKTNINPEYATVDAGSSEIYNYPFVHMTGHGNVEFSLQEAQNMRNLRKSDSYAYFVLPVN